jgi:MYXO-CTERM domain-containing protein
MLSSLSMVSGDVIAVVSHWTADGSRIVTEATVATATGPVVVSQLGGTVDELTMRQFPEVAEPLAIGMRVAIATHAAADLSGTMHEVVDATRVLAYPPGFVRTGKSKGGHYLYWESGCVYVAVADEGTKDVNGDNEFAVVDASIATWNDATASCSYLQVIDEGRRANAEVGGKDLVNLIKFRDASWCRPGTKDDPARCYAMSAAGITTATFVDSTTNKRDGAIVDADIELNAVNFDIGVDGMTLGNAGCIADLQNTLTHELGHLHGLEHTCLTATDPPRVDDQGNDVPLCSPGPLPAAITEATMYNYQDCGETKKSSLEADDIDAICQIYATAKDPGTCAHVPLANAGCCEAGGAPGASVFGMVGVIGLLLRRRRRGL